MRLCISILFFSLMIGCGHSKQETSTNKYFPVSQQQKTLDFDFFTITVPSTWQKANDDTIPALTDATARGRIQIGQHQFLSYEDGLSASDMSESDTNESAYQMAYKVWNSQINGYKAKYFRPKAIGNGFTGVYIDSVDKIESVANLGFSLYGKNLDSIREAEFVKSMQTIKYKHPSY